MAEDAFAVSYLRHDMRGAPVINGKTPGCMIAALDALLVTGWGPAAPQSLTVAAGVATATFASATPWEVGAVIKISGATPEAINGKARVLSSSGNTLTFATTASAGAYSGTIDIRYCPADWEKVFSATNKAVYRSKNPLGNRHYLRVDDSHNQWARVRGFVSMSDIDNGSEPFPNSATWGGFGYWFKSYNNGTAVARPYLMASDDRMMLQAVSFAVDYSPFMVSTMLRGFGEAVSANPAGDAYMTVLSAFSENQQYVDSGGLCGDSSNSQISYGASFAPRAWTGLGAAQQLFTVPEVGTVGDISGNCDAFGAAPSVVDGRLVHGRMLLKDSTPGASIRAIIPGVRFIPQKGVGGLFSAPYAIVPAGASLPGRSLAAVPVKQYVLNADGAGLCFVDITGPWR